MTYLNDRGHQKVKISHSSELEKQIFGQKIEQRVFRCDYLVVLSLHRLLLDHDAMAIRRFVVDQNENGGLRHPGPHMHRLHIGLGDFLHFDWQIAEMILFL